MTSHPIAFVDETFIHRDGHPGAYSFAAVLVDPGELPLVVDAARQAAAHHEQFHATDLYRRGHIQPIEDMLDTTETHAGWTLMVAQTPLGDHQEPARQAALAQLLRQLDAQKVRDVVLDTRASPREQRDTQMQGRKVNLSDRPDITTYQELARSKQISHRMRLQHVDDRHQPALWLADVVAWAFQRALVFDEPQWWSRVADVATIHDAATGKELALRDGRTALPTGERDPRTLSPSAQNPLPQPSFYTLNGGTTNRTQGPGHYFLDLLAQSLQARGTDTNPIASSIRTLAANIEAVAAAIDNTISQHGTPSSSAAPPRPPGRQAEPELWPPDDHQQAINRDIDYP